MIVIDPKHLSGVDFNLSAVVALGRERASGASLGYTDHGRPDHGLCLVRSGGIVCTDAEGRSVVAGVGDVLYLPRGKRYTAVCEGAVSDVLINFLLFDDRGRDLALSDDVFRIAEGADGETVALFDEIAACCWGAGGGLRLKMLLFQLMNRLIVAERQDDSVLSMEECVSYIDAHYAEVREISELATRCGMGETAFRKKFRDHLGMSPVHYINAVKVERACRMLRSSELTVAEICRCLGFYDPAYFHKVFKKYMGVTPGEYTREYVLGNRA